MFGLSGKEREDIYHCVRACEARNDSRTYEIWVEAERRINKLPNLGSIYNSLEHLEREGFLRKEARPPPPERAKVRREREEIWWFTTGKRLPATATSNVDKEVPDSGMAGQPA